MVADPGARVLELVGLRQPAHAGDTGQGDVGERDLDPGTLHRSVDAGTTQLVTAERQHAGDEVPCRQHVVDRYGCLRGPVISGTPTSALME